VVITMTLSWLLYFGLVMIRTLQSDDFGLAENLLPPLGKLLQGLALTPLWNAGLNASAIAAFAGTIWLQIPSLDWHLRRLQMRFYDQGLAPKLLQLGLGISLSGLLLVGDVRTLWAFSAFATLIHRALSHWQAAGYWQTSQWSSFSRMNRRQYLHGGAAAISLMLAFWLDWQVWLVSLGLIALGLVWRGMRQWSETEE
jgi:APA family basic amino acid/polyamine antiporter